MAYYYNVYGPDQVEAARRSAEALNAGAPTFKESRDTQLARSKANDYAEDYQKLTGKGFEGGYGEQINALANKYMTNSFSWNAASDNEYQQLSDKYRREAKRAQEDVQGSYAANTGGYANSYAQAQGQRAHGSYMDALAEKIPQLKQKAMSNYNTEQENTLKKIGVMQGLDDNLYARYRDQVQDNYDFMTYYQNKYASEKGLDMSAFQNELARWNARASAANNNLATIRQLAEQQAEHNTLSADAKASIESSQRQQDAYYDYLYSQIR